jgi:hypothetical protein
MSAYANSAAYGFTTNLDVGNLSAPWCDRLAVAGRRFEEPSLERHTLHVDSVVKTMSTVPKDGL